MLSSFLQRFTRTGGLITLVAIAALVLLQACGGGGGDNDSDDDDAVVAPPTAPATPATANIQLFIADDFSAEHEAVWLTINRISAVNNQGEIPLVSYDPGLVVNLPTLKRTGAWLGNATIPTDASSVRIYVDATAKLQALDGSIKTVSIVTEGGYISLRIDDWDYRSGVLAVDFDLPRFVLQGNTLTIATRVATDSDQKEWTQRYAEAEGSITAINDTSITVNSRRHGTITATLDANTTYRSKTSGWTPTVGSNVELYVLKDENGKLLARTVSDESLSDDRGVIEVEGVVTAVENDQVTINVTKSRSASIVGSFRFSIANARFERGSASILQTSQIIEAYVEQLADSSWRATHVEIEGARKTGTGSSSGDDDSSGGNDSSNDSDNDNHTSDQYAEVKGIVRAVSGNSVTLEVIYAEYLSGVTNGSQFTADISGAYFERGSLACLTQGAPVELKGYVDSTGKFKVVRVELEGACGNSSSSSGGSSSGGSVFVEAEGSVTAVSTNQFTLSVYKIENYNGERLSSLTVTYDSSTIFEDVTPANLQTGMFVEVKGTLTGSTLKAVKVERD
jgi:hypothetical protein